MKNNSFNHWQTHTLAQFSYVINLILGFSVTTLGFQLNNFQNAHLPFSCHEKLFFIISLAALLFSNLFGIFTIINRLNDFRLTMKISKINKRMKSENKTKEERILKLKSKRIKSKILGQRTWVMFYWQIGAFGVGLIFTFLSFFSKLW